MGTDIPEELPIKPDDRGPYVVWDLRSWEGDVETMKDINEAWMDVHSPAAKIGTIPVLPDDVVVHGEIQSFISEGWNEASEATGLQYLALVAENLQAMAVESQIDAPSIEEIRAFQSVEAAVDWMEEVTD